MSDEQNGARAVPDAPLPPAGSVPPAPSTALVPMSPSASMPPTAPLPPDAYAPAPSKPAEIYIVLSFVFSVLGLPIVGVILGHVALKRATHPERTLAIVATSVAWGLTALILLFLIPLLLVFFSTIAALLLALLTVGLS